MPRSFLILAIFASLAAAADREQFTLKDGRVLVGTYDEVTQTLAIESPKASMHVDARDIAKREEAPPEVAPRAVAAKADPAPSAPATPGVPQYMAEVERMSADVQALREQIERLDRQRADRFAEYEKARQTAFAEFIKTADFSPVPIKIPENPSREALQAAEKLRQLNEWMTTAKDERFAASKKNPAPSRIYNRDASRDMVHLYAKVKGLPWAVDLVDNP